MAKIYTHFKTRIVQKPYNPWRGTYLLFCLQKGAAPWQLQILQPLLRCLSITTRERPKYDSVLHYWIPCFNRLTKNLEAKSPEK